MNKKERIKYALGAFLIALMFFSIATVGFFRDEFNITYHYGFDGKYETAKVARGYLKNPLTPGRYGYLFDGWYYDDLFGNEILYDFEAEPVKRDLELTAHWRPFETEAKLYPNGGRCETDRMILRYGEEYTLPTPTRTGYYFAGWMGFVNTEFSSGIWSAPYAEVAFTAKWSKIRPGSAVKMGRYEQDGRSDNGREEIEWIVLDVVDGNYLLVSRYILDSVKLYDQKPMPSDGWRDTNLRAWLNSDFLDSVFTGEEKSIILEYSDVKLGTSDRVFLLSETETFFLVGDDIEGRPTAYAKEKGFSANTYSSFGDTDWWIRAKKKSTCTRAAYSSGSLAGPYGLRPAILLSGEAYDRIFMREEG